MIGGKLPPPLQTHVVLSRNASNRNFEISVAFKIVKISFNKAFGVETNSQSLEARVVSYAPGYLGILWKGWL